MTLSEARDHIGHNVVYRPRGDRLCRAEQGVIANVGHAWVFVAYAPGSTPAATDPADLTLLAGKVATDG